MFVKLLKYDLKSVGRIALPLSLGSIILSVFGLIAAIINLLLNKYSYNLVDLSYEAYLEGNETLSTIYDLCYSVAGILNFLCIITTLFVFLALVSFALAVLVLVVVNFYKTLITDQGYLTFTLPVSPSKILLSKIVNGTFWCTLLFVLAALGTVIMLLPSTIFNEYGVVRMFFDALLVDSNPVTISLVAFLYVAVGFVTIIAAVIYYFFCVFLGGVITPKGKFITGAAFIVLGHIVYYVFSQVVSLIVTLIMLLAYLLMGSWGWISSSAVFDPMLLAIFTQLLSFVFLIIISIVFYSITTNISIL